MASLNFILLIFLELNHISLFEHTTFMIIFNNYSLYVNRFSWSKAPDNYAEV